MRERWFRSTLAEMSESSMFPIAVGCRVHAHQQKDVIPGNLVDYYEHDHMQDIRHMGVIVVITPNVRLAD